MAATPAWRGVPSAAGRCRSTRSAMRCMRPGGRAWRISSAASASSWCGRWRHCCSTSRTAWRASVRPAPCSRRACPSVIRIPVSTMLCATLLRRCFRCEEGWWQRYVGFELDLLADLGFGLDLTTCAVTGTQRGPGLRLAAHRPGGEQGGRRALCRSPVAATRLSARQGGAPIRRRFAPPCSSPERSCAAICSMLATAVCHGRASCCSIGRADSSGRTARADRERPCQLHRRPNRSVP